MNQNVRVFVGQEMYVKAFDKLRADLSQQLADSAPLTGERTAKRMAAMAPSISSMQKMAIGALAAMDNANRLQQMEKEKEEMRERESSMKQQLAAAEHREKVMQVRVCLLCLCHAFCFYPSKSPAPVQRDRDPTPPAPMCCSGPCPFLVLFSSPPTCQTCLRVCS